MLVVPDSAHFAPCTMPQRDLATTEGVTSFLQDTPFDSHTVTPLTGGFGNYVYRIHLRKDYHDRKTLVLKHAKPYIPGARDFAFPLERQVSWAYVFILTTPENAKTKTAELQICFLKQKQKNFFLRNTKLAYSDK